MDRNQKNGIVSFISGIGVIILLGGIFLDYYVFGVGLLIAIGFFIMSGVVATFLGVDDKSQAYYYNSDQGKSFQEPSMHTPQSFEKTQTGAEYCTKCGSRVDKGSSFCSSCGTIIG